MIRTGPLEAHSMCEMLVVGLVGLSGIRDPFLCDGLKWQEVKS